MGGPAPRVARAARRAYATGLAARRRRQRQRSVQKGGAANGPNPTDRGKPGTKRHRVVDARGTPLMVSLSNYRRRPDGGQPSRQHAPRRHPRRDPARALGPAWSPAPQAGQAARGQGLRPSALPPGIPGARDRAAHRAPGRRQQRAPGTAQVNRGTHPGGAVALPSAGHPLRAAR